jgi:hypothetical protein
MSVEMPDPVPLEMPPGDPEAVEELVRSVAGAAFWLAVLRDELSGPAASAPGWLGEDAVAAEAQVVRVARLTRDAADAVLGATGRLSTHGDLLRDTRREVSALRAEQDEDFRAAWQRLGQIENPQLAVMSGAPGWVGVVAEIESAEATRRRRHAVLLEELADDAAATARVLAAAGRPIGGTGRPGDAGRVLSYLAAELPGWGRPELTRRGRVLADALVQLRATPEERAALAAEALTYASNPVFATALIRGLGEGGVGQLLVLLGQAPDGPDTPMAALLASALGAAVPGDGEHDGVAAVLAATYVRADDWDGPSDTAAVGMAAVLSAGTRSAGGGPRTATVGEWARQLLVRERDQGLRAEMPPAGTPWRRDPGDPVAVAVGILAERGEPEVAAALLGDERIWQTLLQRYWDDGGSALGALVAEAGRDAGAAGARAVRLGLETIGAGLFEGDPSDWTVDRDTVTTVAPALGAAVAAHVTVVTGPLTALATGEVGQGMEHGLKALGYLTVDRQVAASIGTALVDWSRTQPLDLTGSGPAAPLPAVAVHGAYFAVQEYGQRLTYALDGFELKEDADNKEELWNWTAGLALELISYAPVKPIALAADVIGAYAPVVLGCDGTFDQSADRGLRFDADMAGANALTTVPHLAERADAVEAQAEASYRRSARSLGSPTAPKSPDTDLVGPAIDIVTGGLVDAGTDELVDRARQGGPFRSFLSGRR